MVQSNQATSSKEVSIQSHDNVAVSASALQASAGPSNVLVLNPDPNFLQSFYRSTTDKENSNPELLVCILIKLSLSLSLFLILNALILKFAFFPGIC